MLVILALGSGYTLATQGSLAFLSPVYLLQQLQVGAFLGIVAAGDDAGHPARPYRPVGALDPRRGGDDGHRRRRAAGDPGRPRRRAAVGIFNGIGVAYLRVPSMIFTLGVNALLRGLMVMHTGGFAPQTARHRR